MCRIIEFTTKLSGVAPSLVWLGLAAGGAALDAVSSGAAGSTPAGIGDSRNGPITRVCCQ
jgi:hypothetical protein